jgi:hypothetical protein
MIQMSNNKACVCFYPVCLTLFRSTRFRFFLTSLSLCRALATIPCLLGAVAFGCSYAGNFFCNNVQFAPQGLEEIDFYSPRPLSFGLWMYRQQKLVNTVDERFVYIENCEGYPEDVEIDCSWKIARAFSCLSVILAGFLMLWQFCAPFLLFDAIYWRWAMFLFSVIGLCQGATLLLLQSSACLDNPMIDLMAANPDIYPEACSWDWGMRACLIGTILYFVTVCSMLLIPAPGTRPRERQFPMMVWDADDDDDEKSVGEGSVWSANSSDSADTFACDDHDFEVEPATQKRVDAKPDLDETEQSFTGYDENEVDPVVSVTEVKHA